MNRRFVWLALVALGVMEASGCASEEAPPISMVVTDPGRIALASDLPERGWSRAFGAPVTVAHVAFADGSLVATSSYAPGRGTDAAQFDPSTGRWSSAPGLSGFSAEPVELALTASGVNVLYVTRGPTQWRATPYSPRFKFFGTETTLNTTLAANELPTDYLADQDALYVATVDAAPGAVRHNVYSCPLTQSGSTCTLLWSGGDPATAPTTFRVRAGAALVVGVGSSGALTAVNVDGSGATPLPPLEEATSHAHDFVWTGHELLHFGFNPSSQVSTGSSLADDWQGWSPLPSMGDPLDRQQPDLAVWTGTEAFIWSKAGSGGFYNPATHSWRAATSAGPAAAELAIAAGEAILVVRGADVFLYRD